MAFNVLKNGEGRPLFVPKFGFAGTSGTGKTYSALLFARGYVGEKGRVLVIDTENAISAYSWLGLFDLATITPIITPKGESKFAYKDFLDGLNYGIKEKYDAIVFDSFSTFWESILDYKTTLDVANPNSNQFANWREPSEMHKQVLNAVLNAPIPIICTFRKKMEYRLEEDARGKLTPKAVGLAPIARDGTQYLFPVWLDFDSDHQYTVGKTWITKLDKAKGVVTEETGRLVREEVDRLNSFNKPA